MARRRLFRSRVQRLRATHSYGIVLLLVIGTVIFAGVGPDTDWSAAVLVIIEAVTLAVALWTSGFAGTDSAVSFGFSAFAIAVSIALIVWGGSTLTGVVALLSGVLTLAIGAAIVVGVIDQGEVNLQTVTGAVCIYLLIGFMFVFIYSAIASLGSGDLFAQGTDGTRGIRVYFSYVTLTTVGYGDYTMRTSAARMFAVLEMLMGQLYLVTVLALLVSRIRPGARLRSWKDTEPED
ncbi:MAG TPA: potassium channel family protein [Gaiellaceae bacterium]|nr:potassium channel family protein [Gaiellaceae bacterium]